MGAETQAPCLGVEAKGGDWTPREECQSHQVGPDLMHLQRWLEIPDLMRRLVYVHIHHGTTSHKFRPKITPFYYFTVSVGWSSGWGSAEPPASSVLTGNSQVSASAGATSEAKLRKSLPPSSRAGWQKLGPCRLLVCGAQGPTGCWPSSQVS